MTTAMTHEHVRHLHAEKEKFKGRVAHYKAKTAKAVQKVVRTLEVTAGATIGGVIQGGYTKTDPVTGKAVGPHFMHVPVDLGLGLIFVVAGAFDAAGDHSDHLVNFGDGLIGAYASNLGFTLGQGWRASGKMPFSGQQAAAALGAPSPAAPALAHGAYDPNTMAKMVADIQAAAQRQAGG